MNIGKSFTYIFDDPRWLNKILIGTLVLIISSLLSTILIGILGYFIIMGYALEVLRNVRRGDRYPLPEWKDRWGEWLVLGVKLTVALLVWALPAILIGLFMIVPAAMMDSNDTMATIGCADLRLPGLSDLPLDVGRALGLAEDLHSHCRD